MEHPSIERVVELVRRQAGLRPSVAILAETRLERDLGVTGDDGDDLLRAAEKEFGVTFTRESFDLKPGEYLFGPEGLLPDLIGLFKHSRDEIKPFTVGDLHVVICKELAKKADTAS